MKHIRAKFKTNRDFPRLGGLKNESSQIVEKHQDYHRSRAGVISRCRFCLIILEQWTQFPKNSLCLQCNTDKYQTFLLELLCLAYSIAGLFSIHPDWFVRLRCWCCNPRKLCFFYLQIFQTLSFNATPEWNVCRSAMFCTQHQAVELCPLSIHGLFYGSLPTNQEDQV